LDQCGAPLRSRPEDGRSNEERQEEKWQQSVEKQPHVRKRALASNEKKMSRRERERASLRVKGF